MTLEEVKMVFSILQGVITAGIAVYIYMSKKDRADAKRLSALESRVTTLEEAMRHLPDQTMVIELAGDMKAVKASLDGVRESLAPLARSVDRINDYLLTRS